MPLVGALDTTPLRQVQEQSLHALESTSAHTLVFDITGVPIVDTQVAQGLLMTVRAARLLGAEVIFSYFILVAAVNPSAARFLSLPALSVVEGSKGRAGSVAGEISALGDFESQHIIPKSQLARVVGGNN
jgi:anti-anti-sigma regulatory factor